MFTKPEQLTSVAVARPMRVAYLIDLDDAPDALFDEINLEAYGRWGGRRTLIAPAQSRRASILDTSTGPPTSMPTSSTALSSSTTP
jgi:hypothetical protein